MAIIFNGSTDSLYWNTSVVNGLSAFTFSMWVKCDGTLGAADWGIIHCNSGGYNNDRGGVKYDAYAASSAQPQAFKFGVLCSTSDILHETEQYTQSNDWQHIIYTWANGQDAFIWADGVKLTNTYTTGSGTGVVDTSPDFVIGRSITHWLGKIKDVKLYNRRLTDNEIITIYNSQGNDNIIDGLIFHEPLDEQIAGTSVTSSMLKDLNRFLGNATTINGTPEYYYGE